MKRIQQLPKLHRTYRPSQPSGTPETRLPKRASADELLATALREHGIAFARITTASGKMAFQLLTSGQVVRIQETPHGRGLDADGMLLRAQGYTVVDVYEGDVLEDVTQVLDDIGRS